MKPFQVYASLLVGLAIRPAARPVAAQNTAADVAKTAAVAGILRDSLGHPIALATISADSMSRDATSDDAGEFAIRGLSPGRVGFHVMRIGYEPLAFSLDLSPDSTLHIEIRLHGSALLQAVVVQGEAPASRLAKTGFYERRRLMNGQFLTPAQVDSSMEYNPSGLLHAFHGVDVICGGSRIKNSAKNLTGGDCNIKSRGAGCLALLVDGHLVHAKLDEVTSRDEIVAVEFYERSDDVPGELQSPMRGTPCAALVVWTKANAG